MASEVPILRRSILGRLIERAHHSKFDKHRATGRLWVRHALKQASARDRCDSLRTARRLTPKFNKTNAMLANQTSASMASLVDVTKRRQAHPCGIASTTQRLGGRW